MPVSLSNKTRDEGIHIISGRGTGKSMLQSQIAFQDFQKGIPTVVFDTGHTIDNILDAVARLSEEDQREAWQRIKCVNMAGMDGYVVPFPIYYRRGKEPDVEPDAEVAERFIDTIRRVNPELESASRQGMNAVERVGRTCGMELIRRGLQLDMADVILKDPHFPERKDQDAFREKVLPIVTHPTARAIYTSTPPGIDWAKEMTSQSIVLLDFRDLRGSRRRFAMVWTFWNLIEYIEKRSDTTPVSAIVDELSVLMKTGTLAAEKQANEDMDELLNHTMRHTNLWLTVAHQQVIQFSKTVIDLLVGMGTQIIGRPETKHDAMALAQSFMRVDPYREKRSIPRYDIYSERGLIRDEHVVELLDEIPVDMSIAEQHHLNADILLNLPNFTFLLRPTRSLDLTPFRIPHDTFASRELAAKIRARLMRRDGISISGSTSGYVSTSPAPIPSHSVQPPSASASTSQSTPVKKISIKGKPPL